MSAVRWPLFFLLFLELFALNIFIVVAYGLRANNSSLIPFLIGLQSIHFYLPFVGFATLIAPFNKYAARGASVSYLFAIIADSIALIIVEVFKRSLSGEIRAWAEAITGTALGIDVLMFFLLLINNGMVTRAARKNYADKVRQAGSYYEADQQFFLPIKKVFKLKRMIARAWVVTLIFYICFYACFLILGIIGMRTSLAIIPSVAFIWSWPMINIVVGPGGKGTDPEPYVRDSMSAELLLTKLLMIVGIVGLCVTGIWIFWSYVESASFTYGVLISFKFIPMNLATKVMLVVTYAFLGLALSSAITNTGLLSAFDSALERQEMRKLKEQ